MSDSLDINFEQEIVDLRKEVNRLSLQRKQVLNVLYNRLTKIDTVIALSTKEARPAIKSFKDLILQDIKEIEAI